MRRELFAAVRSEGALLPPDLIRRIVERDPAVPGVTPDAYHLSGETLNEGINGAWNHLLGAWAAFTEARAKLAPDETGTSVTRERWLLPLFQELGYGRLPSTRPIIIDGTSYPVSHLWVNVPIHLIGSGVGLDTRTPGIAGAARSSPHGLVQVLLNRSAEYQWGALSNGLRLRLLRDDASLTRQAYVEFDLETIFSNELYSDFVPLWLLVHESRVEQIQGGEGPHDCWLERWVAVAAEQGTRALDRLRAGVESAITTLGNGFLVHPSNRELRDSTRSGALSPQEYYRQLLRLVYRLIFLFVTEDRGLLLDPAAASEARERYIQYYSTAHLRDLAEHLRGGRHTDLYDMLRLVMRGLGSAGGISDLGLPGLGSFLWSAQGVAAIEHAEITNRDLLEAVRALAFTDERPRRRSVDYRNLGTEELGSVYESLLELHPAVNADAGAFALQVAPGHERRMTGSYYTPSSLINLLLDSALEPVIDERLRGRSGRQAEEALLSLRVIDPAAGSGHFLVAAANRMAKRLARIRTGDAEPSPEAMPPALREVIGRCMYAVDQNDMAVELCKVSLWLESVEPGRPLSFLDAHVRRGNSLIGTVPWLLGGGIPDAAYTALAEDDKALVRELRERNRAERHGQLALDERDHLHADWREIRDEVKRISALAEVAEERFEDVAAKQAQYGQLLASRSYGSARAVADAWCVAFVAPKVAGVPRVTTGLLRRLAAGSTAIQLSEQKSVADVVRDFGFFHWHLEFPDVFALTDEPAAPWEGGFDIVLGNPPWDQVEFEEREFFAARRPDIASAKGAKRKATIKDLESSDPALFAEYRRAARRAEAEDHFLRHSGRFPLSARGRMNTYPLFVETMRMVVSPAGRVGAVVPTGIATDEGTMGLFGELVGAHALVSLYDFENRNGLFPAVHRSYRFSVLTFSGANGSSEATEFGFFLHDALELADPERRFVLTPEDLTLLNPNTRTCPTFRTRRDAELTKAIYRRVRVFVEVGRGEAGNPWAASYRQGLFNMTSDSGLFVDHAQDGCVPLYEAKMIHQFNHRYASFESRRNGSEGAQLPAVSEAVLSDPGYRVSGRYWVSRAEVDRRLDSWTRDWLVGFRRIARTTDERTLIAAVIPRVGAGDSLQLLFSNQGALGAAALVANLNALAFDYAARQKVPGVNVLFFIVNQLPVLPPDRYSAASWDPAHDLAHWIAERVLELTYVSRDTEAFARDLGYMGPPFRWNGDRRRHLVGELDAAFFRLYGLTRAEAEYVLETFPVLRRSEERLFGRYVTRERVLEAYDRLAAVSSRL